MLALTATTLAQLPGSTELTQSQQRDRAIQVQRTLPASVHPYGRFLTLQHLEREKREQLAAALRFFVPSVSLQVELDHQIPRPVRGSNMLYIDLYALNWRYEDWVRVMRRYPYSDKRDKYGNVNPLIVRGDWLLYELSDTSVSLSYYDLLYGRRGTPKTREEFLKIVRVDRRLQRGFELSFVEGKSGVAVNKKRMIDFFDRPFGYVWGTRDTLKVNRQTDPFEHLERDQKHDGEEWIAGIPKRSSKYGRFATAQIYLLANGQGKRVEEAPVGLVEDHTHFRGLSSIRTPGSCIQCHERGINDTTENEVLAAWRDGIDLRIDKKIERTLLTYLDTEIRRNQEDSIVFLAMCNPTLAPEQNAAAFQASINEYGAEVDLAKAARELYSTPDELRNALGYYTAHNGVIGGRLSALAEGRAMLRTSWEDEFFDAQRALFYWRSRN